MNIFFQNESVESWTKEGESPVVAQKRNSRSGVATNFCVTGAKKCNSCFYASKQTNS